MATAVVPKLQLAKCLRGLITERCDGGYFQFNLNHIYKKKAWRWKIYILVPSHAALSICTLLLSVLFRFTRIEQVKSGQFTLTIIHYMDFFHRPYLQETTFRKLAVSVFRWGPSDSEFPQSRLNNFKRNPSSSEPFRIESGQFSLGYIPVFFLVKKNSLSRVTVAKQTLK